MQEDHLQGKERLWETELVVPLWGKWAHSGAMHCSAICHGYQKTADCICPKCIWSLCWWKNPSHWWGTSRNTPLAQGTLMPLHMTHIRGLHWWKCLDVKTVIAVGSQGLSFAEEWSVFSSEPHVSTSFSWSQSPVTSTVSIKVRHLRNWS